MYRENSNAISTVSLETKVSKEEWRVRCDLAAAYRVAHHLKWTDLIFTHFTARVPGSEHFLINPYGLLFNEITASNLVKIDSDANIIEDVTGLGVNPAGFVIHGCIHEARPEVGAVLHTHTRAGVAVSAYKDGLLPISQHAARTYGMVTYHDYEGIALDLEERVRLASDLGKESRAMILRNHGLLTVGKTVAEAVEVMYYLDAACQIQIDAVAAGVDNLLRIPEEIALKVYKQFENAGGYKMAMDTWNALTRMLDNQGVNYRA
ncbi:MAG: class II aldolase/adducin family protein [Betaproteobacteria bacterium]|jgi:ribulose-5-phosphate 4-epimerase/fuculose-1-phosphate aldolase